PDTENAASPARSVPVPSQRRSTVFWPDKTPRALPSAARRKRSSRTIASARPADRRGLQGLLRRVAAMTTRPRRGLWSAYVPTLWQCSLAGTGGCRRVRPPGVWWEEVRCVAAAEPLGVKLQQGVAPLDRRWRHFMRARKCTPAHRFHPRVVLREIADHFS